MAKLNILALQVDNTYQYRSGTVHDRYVREGARRHALVNTQGRPWTFPVTDPKPFSTWEELVHAPDPEPPLDYDEQMLVVEHDAYFPVPRTDDELTPEIQQAHMDAEYERWVQQAQERASRDDMELQDKVVMVGGAIAGVATIMMVLIIVDARFI